VFVHAPQIAAPYRDPVAIEEFKNLDGDLAAIVELIAEIGGGELAVRRFGRKRRPNLHHVRHCRAKKEMIVRHLIDLAETAEQLENPAHLRFGNADDGADIADARWAKALLAIDQGLNTAPEFFFGGRQAHVMARQPRPCAVERHFAKPRQALQRCSEGRRRQTRFEMEPEPLESDARQIGVIAMESCEPVEHVVFELQPSVGQQRDHRALDRNAHQPELFR
jgi:hypothetical protein